MKLTQEEKEILNAVIDGFIPSIQKENDVNGFWKRKGSDLPIADHIIEIISALPIESQKEFKELISLLGSKKLYLTWFGAFKNVKNLSTEQKQKMLNKWADSSVPPLRKAYLSLKKLIGLCYLGTLDENQYNPNWSNVDYDGPDLTVTSFDEKEVSSWNIKQNQMISCDVVVVGSGAGGGVVADELVKKGKDVIILEKGPNITGKEMTGYELEMLGKSYDRKGAFTSVDGCISVLAGSCVGGGTTVNWSGMFRTPDYILEEWAKEHDNPHFLEKDYKKCFEHIEKRTSTNTHLSERHNPQNQKLWNGSQKLGYDTKLIARNVAAEKGQSKNNEYWKSQGFAGLCDKFGYKQSTMKTFLQDAVDGGARIMANTRVESINHSQGKVDGVVAYQSDANGHRYKITISCKQVVVSAGAIHTPTILMKSGLKHPQIGKNLYLHPTNAVSAEYAETMNSWHGPMMSAVCDEFTRLDGNFGYKIETPPLHPAFLSMSTPWTSGEQFKEDLLHLKNVGAFIVLTRDKFGGSISLSKEGRPLVNY
ncbi:MAG: FAD-dependent oxidoreductase, partial [Saprospiraceae bacterium]